MDRFGGWSIRPLSALIRPSTAPTRMPEYVLTRLAEASTMNAVSRPYAGGLVFA